MKLFRVYGSTQQFISYDFYENVIRFAVSKGYLDADLNKNVYDWRERCDGITSELKVLEL